MNIYVGNLPYGITDEDLAKMFEEFGEISSANVIKDRFSGRSKGFGFVEMPDDSEAENAIENLNGSDMDGRAIVVNKARPREERPQQRRPRRN